LTALQDGVFLKKKYYFTQISAILIAVLSSYITFELLDNWFQTGNIVHELFFATIICFATFFGMILWGKILYWLGILSKKEAKGFPYSKPWETDDE